MVENLNWRGEALQEKIVLHGARAINETMGECVGEAKSDQLSWKNVSGTASRSIKVVEPAKPGVNPKGEWGSQGVVYMARLEFEHGAKLRTAAARQYPTLAIRFARMVKNNG